jgi:hypothetical protein
MEDRAMSDTHSNEHERESAAHIEPRELARIGSAGLAIAVSWVLLWQPLAQIDVIGPVAVLVCSYPVFHETFADLATRRLIYACKKPAFAQVSYRHAA